MSRAKKEKRKAELARRYRNRRIFQAVGGISLAGIITSGVFLSIHQSSNKRNQTSIRTLENMTFEKAKQNPNLRTNYINQITKKYSPPVEDVNINYIHNKRHCPNSLFKNRDIIMRTGFEGNKEDPVQNVQTQIFRDTFRDCKNEDEFLSGLVDHEYDHLKVIDGKDVIDIDQSALEEFYERALTVGGDLFEHYLELRGFKAQIQAFQKRKNLTESYKRNIISTYNAYRELVERKEPTSLTNWLLNQFPKITYKN